MQVRGRGRGQPGLKGATRALGREDSPGLLSSPAGPGPRGAGPSPQPSGPHRGSAVPEPAPAGCAPLTWLARAPTGVTRLLGARSRPAEPRRPSHGGEASCPCPGLRGGRPWGQVAWGQARGMVLGGQLRPHQSRDGRCHEAWCPRLLRPQGQRAQEADRSLLRAVAVRGGSLVPENKAALCQVPSSIHRAPEPPCECPPLCWSCGGVPIWGIAGVTPSPASGAKAEGWEPSAGRAGGPGGAASS